MKAKGFTLVESLVSMGILSFLLLVLYGVLHTGNMIYTNDTTLLEVQQHARNGMDRIVREVREASAHTITGGNQISVVTPGGTVVFSLSGTNLVRNAGTARNIATNISALSFSASGTLLTIQLTATKSMLGKTATFSLAEEVRLRNE